MLIKRAYMEAPFFHFMHFIKIYVLNLIVHVLSTSFCLQIWILLIVWEYALKKLIELK